MTRAAGTSRITHLERRRREMAAAYVKATRRHAPRAALAQKLVRATCDALRAELKAEQAAARQANAAPDLFTAPSGANGADQRAAA
ncbi:hypothetical protein [Xanthobacter sp. 91]|uniref:hypothetical protein n=1 Tax=Xanthobacter sp. 91 TaxID=1117244 RepID=UPI0004958EB5|nr:hypothetical protein [Xanthobacter sp. 91]